MTVGMLHKLRPIFEPGGTHTALLALFGVTAGLRAIAWVLQHLYTRLRRKPKDVRSYGKWAIVTGCTSGIGQSFALELASRGMHILLISRNEDKLLDTVSQIQKKHRVDVRYMVHDFADIGEDSRAQFASQLARMLQELSNDGKVGMLINAVGVANNIPTLLHETEMEDMEQMLEINSDGTLQMTMAVLPYMLENKSGAIITVSSGSCIHPTPMLSIYSATKAFGHSLTRGLYDHFSSNEGIDCLSIRPYYFISNMFQRRRATLMAPFPVVITTAALDVLGYKGDAAPYWAHYLGALLSKWTPHDPAERILLAMQRTRARQLRRVMERTGGAFASSSSISSVGGESAAWR